MVTWLNVKFARNGSIKGVQSLKVFGKNLQHHGCVIHARKSRNNSRNKHSCTYSKVIVVGFQVSSFVCVACIH